MKNFLRIQIIIAFIIFLTQVMVVFASSTVWQQQYQIYQAAQNKFNSNQTDNAEKEKFVQALNLIIEYQKLIKEEIKDLIFLKEEDKNLFMSVLDTNLATVEKISQEINQNSNTVDLAKIQDEISSCWQTIRANNNQMRGIILIRKSEQAIEKINLIITKLQEQIKPEDQNDKTIFSEIDTAKKNIETASQIKNESQIMFNAITRDQTNANTLYNEGRTKFRNVYFSIKQSLTLLEKVNNKLLTK